MDFNELSRQLRDAPPIDGGGTGLAPNEIERLYQSSLGDGQHADERSHLVDALQSYIHERVRSGASGYETLIVPVVFDTGANQAVVSAYAVRIGWPEDDAEVAATDELLARIGALARASGTRFDNTLDSDHDDDDEDATGRNDR